MVEAQTGSAAEVRWEARIPLLSNPFVWADYLKALLLALILLGLVTALLFWDDWQPFWLSWLRILGIAAAAATAAFLIALLLMRGRQTAAFAMDEDGAWLMRPAAGEAPGRLRRALGSSAGPAQPFGGALLTSATASMGVTWPEVTRIRGFPRMRVVVLSARFRPLLRLYCPDAERYLQVLEFAREHASGADRDATGPS